MQGVRRAKKRSTKIAAKGSNDIDTTQGQELLAVLMTIEAPWAERMTAVQQVCMHV
jgi:hypothetical protein